MYRHEAYENFYLLYKYLVDVMKAISEQDSSYGDMSWDSKTIVAANWLSKLYHSFTFITSFIITMNAMSVIRPISVKLQHRSYDMSASDENLTHSATSKYFKVLLAHSFSHKVTGTVLAIRKNTCTLGKKPLSRLFNAD